MKSEGEEKKQKMGLVYNTLESALQALNEAHRICYEELHPTWQTVDQDIEVITGSLQTIVKDLAQRDIEKTDQKVPIRLGPAPSLEPATKEKEAEEDEYPPECPWCGSYRTKKHSAGESVNKSQKKIYICGSCENTFTESESET